VTVNSLIHPSRTTRPTLEKLGQGEKRKGVGVLNALLLRSTLMVAEKALGAAEKGKKGRNL